MEVIAIRNRSDATFGAPGLTTRSKKLLCPKKHSNFRPHHGLGRTDVFSNRSRVAGFGMGLLIWPLPVGC